MKSHVDQHPGLRDYLAKMGTTAIEHFEIAEEEFLKNLSDITKHHPNAEGVSYVEFEMVALANTIWHKYFAIIKDTATGEKIMTNFEVGFALGKKILFWLKIIAFVLCVLAVERAHGQIDVIKIQDNTGAPVKTFAAPFTLKAGANCSPSVAASILTFNCSGGAGGAGGSNTQIQYNATGSLAGSSVGTYIVGSTQFNFQVGTHFQFLDPADTTKVAQFDASGIAAGATRVFKFPNVGGTWIASTNLGASGQAFLSNGDGSGVFADPIVSGPDAVGAAPTKNPVQTGCLFLTTPATLTNNQVGAIQCDALQNLLVKFANTSITANAGTNLNTSALALEAGGNLASIKADVDKIPTSPSTDRTTAGAPSSVELSDGAAFYTGAKTGQLPTALDGSGFLKVHEQGTPTVTANIGTSGSLALDATLTGGTAKAIPEPSAASGDAVLGCNILSAASTNSTNCKVSAGNFYGFEIYNTTTTIYYLRLYNTASAPTCSSSTGFIRSIPIKPADASGNLGGAISNQPLPVNYATGISFCITGGSSSTDNTNAAVGIFGEIRYK